MDTRKGPEYSVTLQMGQGAPKHVNLQTMVSVSIGWAVGESSLIPRRKHPTVSLINETSSANSLDNGVIALAT